MVKKINTKKIKPNNDAKSAFLEDRKNEKGQNWSLGPEKQKIT